MNYRGLIVILCWMWMAGILSWPPSVVAQDTSTPASASASSRTLASGMDAFETGDYDRAESILSALSGADSLYHDPDRGSAAYWLGRVYLATDRPDEAVRVWEAGWYRLVGQEIFDLRLADAFVWHVFGRRDSSHYAAAASMYLALLEHLHEAVPAERRRLAQRHLEPLVLILPDHVAQSSGLSAGEESGGLMLAQGGGAELVQWWKSQDPLPATPENERLSEHLERVLHAWHHFRDARFEDTYDDRGRVYVRLGPPSHSTFLSFTEELSNASAFKQVDFPENEFWVYRHVDIAAHFLFVKRHHSEGYRLGNPYDLVPKSLRHRQGDMRLLELMETIYRKLALYHPQGHYGSYYERVASYTGMMEDVEFGRSVPSPSGMPAAAASTPRPAATAESLLRQAQSDDRRYARRRDEQLPRAYTNLFDAVERLPVELRWARFLDDDGTTRTEVYWQARALHPELSRPEGEDTDGSGRYQLNLTVLQQTATYRQRLKSILRHRLYFSEQETGVSEMPVQVFTARGDTGWYHLAMQWDLVRVEEDDDSAASASPPLKVANERVDSLRGLRSDAEILEMSDLKPLYVEDEERPLESVIPYVQRVITSTTPLAVYFEVYHLNFGGDDRTRYTVAYEVSRKDERSGLLRLDEREASQTGVETEYSGDSRTARETILLDLGSWSGTGPIVITLRVTDQTTGQTVERSLTFEMKA